MSFLSPGGLVVSHGTGEAGVGKLDDSRYRSAAEAWASIGIVLDFGMAPPKFRGHFRKKITTSRHYWSIPPDDIQVDRSLLISL